MTPKPTTLIGAAVSAFAVGAALSGEPTGFGGSPVVPAFVALGAACAVLAVVLHLRS